MTTINYGTTQGVATLVRQYADNRGDSIDFTDTTKPTSSQLQRWLEQLSSMMNTALRNSGFQVPVEQEHVDPYNEITFQIEGLAATMVEGVNGFQRHASNSKKGWSLAKAFSDARMAIAEWVEDNKIGLEEGGVPVLFSDLDTLMVKDVEGNDSIFRRNQYNQRDTTL